MIISGMMRCHLWGDFENDKIMEWDLRQQSLENFLICFVFGGVECYAVLKRRALDATGGDS